MTHGVFVGALMYQKSWELRRDEVYLKVLWKLQCSVKGTQVARRGEAHCRRWAVKGPSAVFGCSAEYRSAEPYIAKVLEGGIRIEKNRG